MVLFIFVLGLAVGSFLNVVVDRLPKNESINGRSHCDFCRQKLVWYDLIPVFSFLFLRGRCRYCHKKLSWQYPIVEFVTGLSFVLVWVYGDRFFISGITNYGLRINLVERVSLLGIVSCLIVIFFSDLKYHLISEWILLILLIFSFLTYLFRSFQIGNILLSGIVVMLPILFLYLITRGRGMGFGDVELAFVMGILLGIKGGLIGLYIAFIIGGLVGAILLLTRKKKWKSAVAFGPFLTLATAIVVFFGPVLNGWLARRFGF